jgi:hypothetical protein
MSEIINWKVASRQRDTIIAEKVMGWKQHPSDIDETCTQWESPQGDWYLLSDADGVPHYTTSMDAAWLVVRMMNVPHSPAFPDYRDYANFIDCLQEIVGSDLFFDLFYCDADGDHLTPERLCIAALRALGYTVETEVQP